MTANRILLGWPGYDGTYWHQVSGKTSSQRLVHEEDDDRGQKVFADGCGDQLSKTIVTSKDCGTRILMTQTTCKHTKML
jgi:hypothetical protein